MEKTEPDKEIESSCGGEGQSGEKVALGQISRGGGVGPVISKDRVRAKAPRRGCLTGLRKAGVSVAGARGARGR